MTAVAIVFAGRARPDGVHGLLVTGAALLGIGLGRRARVSLAAAAPGFVVAAFGAGLVTALGYPYFARFVPEDEAGRYSGVFFAGALGRLGRRPARCRAAIELSGSYKAVLWFAAIRCSCARAAQAAEAHGGRERRWSGRARRPWRP